MFFEVSSGNDIPNEINVIIEIPAHQDPIKYEVDKKTGAIFVDRFMATCMHYPCNYGYIPQTLAEDGDPTDVLVVTPFSVVPGAIIKARPVGMLKMSDESGTDYKILAVPISKLTPLYSHCESLKDMPKLLLKQIQHFFEHYKDLEHGKWVKVEEWVDKDEACKEIQLSIERYVDGN